MRVISSQDRTSGTLKRTYGLSRVRYITLEKVANEVILKAIAYTLTRVVTAYGNFATSHY